MGFPKGIQKLLGVGATITAPTGPTTTVTVSASVPTFTGSGTPEGHQTATAKNETYIDSTTGDLWIYNGTPPSNTGWVLQGGGGIQSGAGSPVGVVVPNAVGDLYIDTSTPALWQATAGPTAAHIEAASPPTAPITVVTGVNDEFVFTPGGGGGTPVTYTIAPGVYGTATACAAAMHAALHAGHAFSVVVDVVLDGDTGAISLSCLVDVGAAGNGDVITPGSHDVSASLGFANPTTFAGGDNGAWILVGSAVFPFIQSGAGDPVITNPTVPFAAGAIYEDIADSTGQWFSPDGIRWTQPVTFGGELSSPTDPALYGSIGSSGVIAFSDAFGAGIGIVSLNLTEPLRVYVTNGNPNGVVAPAGTGCKCFCADETEWTSTLAGSQAVTTADTPLASSITVATGVNDQFVFTGPAGAQTITLRAGTYSGSAAIVQAVALAIEISSQAVSVGDVGSSIVFGFNHWGTSGNGYTISEGNGAAALLGFTATGTMAGGADGIWVRTDAPGLMESTGATGVIFPEQQPTSTAPTYVKGGVYFDTTLNKLRVGGATAWETITSA